jgi:hypothetical protein
MAISDGGEIWSRLPRIDSSRRASSIRRQGLPASSITIAFADWVIRIPVDVRAPNPITGSGFRELGIQTVRNDLESEDVAPFTTEDDPFDEEFGAPYFALYGVSEDGLLEHIADRRIYSDALSLANRLAPGAAFPNKPICFTI